MTRFLALPSPYTREVALDFVTGAGHEGRDEGTGIGCAVVESATGRLVGAAALRTVRRPGHRLLGRPGRARPRLRRRGDPGAGPLGFERRPAPDQSRCAVAQPGLGPHRARRGLPLRGHRPRRRREPWARQRPPSAAATLARFARLAERPRRADPPRLPPGAGRRAERRRRHACAPLAADGRARPRGDRGRGVACAGASAGSPAAAEQVAATAARAGLDWLVGHHRALRRSWTSPPAGSPARCKLRLSGPPQVGGVGYGVHPAFRGRGYTTRALRLLVPWAFEHGRLGPPRTRRQDRERGLAARRRRAPASHRTASAPGGCATPTAPSATRSASSCSTRATCDPRLGLRSGYASPRRIRP